MIQYDMRCQAQPTYQLYAEKRNALWGNRLRLARELHSEPSLPAATKRAKWANYRS